MPGWAWALIVAAVAVPVLVVGSILALTLIGRKADTGHWPEATRNEFIAGCTQAGGSTTQCRCALGVVEENITASEVQRMRTDDEMPGWLVTKVQDRCS